MKQLAGFMIFAGLAALCLSVGCSEDLGIEEQRFKCTESSECLTGFECLPVGDDNVELKSCQRPVDGADAGETDVHDAAADVSDADAGAPGDTRADTPDVGRPDADASEPDTAPAEICDNGADDDNNGETDCADPACQNAATCICGANEDCGATEACNSQTQRCEPVPLFIEITDITPGEDPTCDGENQTQPGADVYDAMLLDVQNSPIGYGKFVRGEWVGESNATTENIAQDAFDGTRVDPNACPGPQVALGCGGSVYLSFINPDTQQEILLSEAPENARVQIFENDETCGLNGEPWQASVCRYNSTQIETNQQLACDVLGSNTGTGEVSL